MTLKAKAVYVADTALAYGAEDRTENIEVGG
jgi:hypothetical protein